MDDIVALIRTMKPQIEHSHNLEDKPDTYVEVILKMVELFEDWSALDWMVDQDIVQ